MTRRRGVLSSVIAAGLLLATMSAGVALAQEPTPDPAAPSTTAPDELNPVGRVDGPRVVLDRRQAEIGEPIIVDLFDFDAPYVDVMLCGNLAVRGSADCNVTAGVSRETSKHCCSNGTSRPDGGPVRTQLVTHAPPVPCPCVVHAASPDGAEFAVAPIELIGHPVAEVKDPARGPLVEMDVTVDRVSAGLVDSVRTLLGGPTTYRVTASVRNISTGTLNNLAIDGSVGRWIDDDAAGVDFELPGPLEPGHTWTQDVEVEVSAPVVGRHTVEVLAKGAGPTVAGSASVRNVPILLFIGLAILVVDLALVVFRFFRHRTRAVEQRRAELEAEDDGIGWLELQPEYESDEEASLA